MTKKTLVSLNVWWFLDHKEEGIITIKNEMIRRKRETFTAILQNNNKCDKFREMLQFVNLLANAQLFRPQ